MYLILVFLIFGGGHLSEAATLICYNGTLDNYQEVTFDNASMLIKSNCINVSRDTLFYTFGYKAMVNGSTTTSAMGACLNDTIQRNCVLLNWQEEASTNNLLGVEVSYAVKAVPNSIKIGTSMAEVLLELSNNNNLNLTRVILMAHSLGAHLWGNTGRQIKASGGQIGIIAGLDPAGPLYNKSLILRPEPLNAASAKFVYCLHSNPGNYGINSSECTVDIWANYGHYINGDNLQPGCKNGSFAKFTTDDLCSHNRAVLLTVYAMLVNRTSLVASKASNYYDWVAANGTATETIYVGDLINTQASSGNYYLSTNPPPNYGKGSDGLRP